MKIEEHPLFTKPPLIGYRSKDCPTGLVYVQNAEEYAMHALGYERRPLAKVDENIRADFEKLLIGWFYSDWDEIREVDVCTPEFVKTTV